MIYKNELVYREDIKNSQSIVNYIFSLILFFGSLGFVIAGVSSYFMHSFLFFLNVEDIIFFPQGLTMLFYGTLGIILSIYQFFIITSKVGDGFNEFDKGKNIMRIYRKGFPGKKGEVYFEKTLSDIVRIL